MERKIEKAFIVSGVTGVIEEWIKNGMVQAPSYISDVIHQLLLKIESQGK
ncbi:hypothetical protein CHCC20335_2053 [Bacillus paralicheniformis]|nr:TetR-like C-terminal domain-containing protein [Bacillus sonorensis]TWK79115.1 hypothetical protein CHCC20335_2053 [Bacillus paralicheniformis]GIN66562.1 hypothetical protein J41TS2_19830 [Bacillus sonorensis]